MFYVYEWFIKETGEIIYVGKGSKNRYKSRQHNRLFKEMINRFDCDSRIVKYFENEQDAFNYELERTIEMRLKGQCVCNLIYGGTGGETKSWTQEKREQYSLNNVMKSKAQRERMSVSNPMKDKQTALKVGEKFKRAVIVEEQYYPSIKEATQSLSVTEMTIRKWIKRGYSSNQKKCCYADGMPVKSHQINDYKHKLSKMAKPILVDKTMYFESVAYAANYLGATPSNLRLAIKRDNTYKGHFVEYVNQKPSQGKSDNSTLKGSTTNE